MTDKANKFNKTLLWDKENSTFIQRIVLHQSRKEFFGYSKKIAFEEKNDKDAVLINWIIRMYETGYLDEKSTQRDKIEYIEYFRNDKPDPTFIVRLYYRYPEWNPAFLNNKRLVHFINKFYSMIEQGVGVAYIKKSLYINSRSKASDPLDLSVHRFSNERHLANFCADILNKQLRPEGEIQHFFHQYKQKYFSPAAQ